MESYFKSMTPMGVSKRQGDFVVDAEYYWREGDGNDPLTEETAEEYERMPELFDGEVKQQWRVIFISGEPSDMEDYEIYHFKRFNKWSEAEKFCALLKERRKAGSLKLSPQFWHLEKPFAKRLLQYERA